MAESKDTAHPNFILGSRVLVFGGSSGIGFAVASGALANGATVHITSSNAEKQAAAVARLQHLYPNALVTASQANLLEIETLEANLTHVLEQATSFLGGPLDHIVYCAGDALKRAPLADLSAHDALKPLNIRYVGPFIIGKLVSASSGRYLNRTAASSITLTSGAGTHRPSTNTSSVVAAGGAVEFLTKGLAVDLAPVRVNVVVPGLVKTELVDTMPAAALEAFKEKSLTKQLGSAQRAAEAYLFCMRCDLATGQSFVIDNGFLMSS